MSPPSHSALQHKVYYSAAVGVCASLCKLLAHSLSTRARAPISSDVAAVLMCSVILLKKLVRLGCITQENPECSVISDAVYTKPLSHAHVHTDKSTACPMYALCLHAFAGGMGIGSTVSQTLKQPQFLEDPHGAARTIWEKTGLVCRQNVTGSACVYSICVGE